MWNLQRGASMNSLYTNEFLKIFLKDVNPAIKSVSPQIKVAGDSVTVGLEFTPK